MDASNPHRFAFVKTQAQIENASATHHNVVIIAGINQRGNTSKLAVALLDLELHYRQQPVTNFPYTPADHEAYRRSTSAQISSHSSGG